MPDYGHDLRFGVFITPDAEQAGAVVELARLADAAGLDYVTFQDHPYQRRFLDAWTLLSVVAAQTTSVRLALNVANLPLRDPLMLAKSVASLDVLSGGRVELGLGAGAFWEAIAAMGGPHRTPGESVAALREAVEIIRAAWASGGKGIAYEGEHYTVKGARMGPPPAHAPELWIGAYKPRMLRLTGAHGDGWLPSAGYLDLGDVPEMNARIDAAASEAGRRPEDVRRMLNLPGDLLDDAPAERLTELHRSHGMSVFFLPVASADAVRRFGEEVAPAVREAAEPGRGSPPQEQSVGQHLVDVHDHLRAELAQLRDLVQQVAAGTASARAARTFITRMTIRQNNWTLGTFCETYCRVVTQHHTLEDRSVFPHLRRSEPELAQVLDRLHEEHEAIAELLERVDRALVALVSPEQADGLAQVEGAVGLLGDALLAHFTYEERELIGPLDRHGFY